MTAYGAEGTIGVNGTSVNVNDGNVNVNGRRPLLPEYVWERGYRRELKRKRREHGQR